MKKFDRSNLFSQTKATSSRSSVILPISTESATTILKNREGHFRMGAERYNPKALRLNIERIKQFIKASEGLTNSSVFPVFLESLKNVHAPKSRQNIANVLMDFMNFLTEMFGAEGPGIRKLVKPESIKAQLKVYKQTSDKPAKQWWNMQVMMDFQDMPCQSELKEVRSKVTNLAEILLERGHSRKVLNDDDYLLLLKRATRIFRGIRDLRRWSKNTVFRN